MKAATESATPTGGSATASGRRVRSARRPRTPASVLTLAMIYLLLPLLATLLYAVAREWQGTLLPSSWTFRWFTQLWQDPRFFQAFGRSLFVCLVSLALSLIITVPTVILASLYAPRLERIISVLSLLPYAIPGVVAAAGLLRLYSTGVLPIAGTVWLLIGAYFVAALPYMVQGVRNGLLALQARSLLEAASLLGASPWQSMLRILIPNLLPGIAVSALLTFAVLFGEFVLANIMVGGSYETMQIYMYRRQSESGHLSSAIAITYFALVLVLSAVMLRLGNRALGSKKARSKDQASTKEETSHVVLDY